VRVYVPHGHAKNNNVEKEKSLYSIKQKQVNRLHYLLHRNCNTEMADDETREQPVQILPNLYIGNLRSAKNKKQLKTVGITHILVASPVEPEFPKQFNYKCINVDDSDDADLAQHLQGCFEYIDTAISSGGIVLIHCLVGISRSPSIAIAYLMFKDHLSYEEAADFVKKKQPLMEPNMGFVRQLKEFEKKIADD